MRHVCIDMFQPSRAIPSAVYLMAMVLTLVAALKWQITIITLFSVGVQILCAFWYGISCIYLLLSHFLFVFTFVLFRVKMCVCSDNLFYYYYSLRLARVSSFFYCFCAWPLSKTFRTLKHASGALPKAYCPSPCDKLQWQLFAILIFLFNHLFYLYKKFSKLICKYLTLLSYHSFLFLTSDITRSCNGGPGGLGGAAGWTIGTIGGGGSFGRTKKRR